MAFVYQAERDLTKLAKTFNAIGPGIYHKEN
jgi:hypothetical protein